MTDTQETTTDSAINKKKWKNRRWMAWTCLISMIIATYAILFTPLIDLEKLKLLSGTIIFWFYSCCTTVIIGYMGVTTIAYWKDKS